jgi:hypothetical protein
LWNSLRPSASDKESTLSAGACPIYMDESGSRFASSFIVPCLAAGSGLSYSESGIPDV